MCGFQVLVETVSLGNELLLPLPESLLLHLDLFGESLPQRFLFFLELGVVQLPGPGLAEFPRLHLLCTVGLVVLLFGGVDEVKHVGADKNRAQLLEVTVVLVLDFRNTPSILATLDDPVVVGLDVLLGSNHGVRHGRHQAACVVGGMLVILFNRWGVDLDSLGFDNSLDLLTNGLVCCHHTLIQQKKKMPYSLLVSDQVGGAKGIGLGDDGDEVNARTQPLHNFNIERLQGVSGGSDEVQASVNAHVNLVRTTGLLFLQHVRLMLVVEEFDDGLPRVAVVDVVSETGGINDRQTN